MGKDREEVRTESDNAELKTMLREIVWMLDEIAATDRVVAAGNRRDSYHGIVRDDV